MQIAEKYFSEMTRQLKELGIGVGEEANDILPIRLNGQQVMAVTKHGAVLLLPEAAGNQEAHLIYSNICDLASEVKEYMAAMERAPKLEAHALYPSDNFRLLADFNGYVLAGRAMEMERGYEFVTWEWNDNRSALYAGSYFTNNYGAAKEHFAVRSGLIPNRARFTDGQLTELYRCSEYFLSEGPALNPEQEDALASARKQIELTVLGLPERLEKGQTQTIQMDM